MAAGLFNISSLMDSGSGEFTPDMLLQGGGQQTDKNAFGSTEPIPQTGNPQDDELTRTFRAMIKPQVKPNFGKLGLGALAMIGILAALQGKRKDYGVLGKEDRSQQGQTALAGLMNNYLGGVTQQNQDITANNQLANTMLGKQLLEASKLKTEHSNKLAQIEAKGKVDAKTKAIPTTSFHGNLTQTSTPSTVMGGVLDKYSKGQNLNDQEKKMAEAYLARESGISKDKHQQVFEQIVQKVMANPNGAKSLSQGERDAMNMIAMYRGIPNALVTAMLNGKKLDFGHYFDDLTQEDETPQTGGIQVTDMSKLKFQQ